MAAGSRLLHNALFIVGYIVVFSYLVMCHGAKILGHSGGVCPVHVLAYGLPMIWERVEMWIYL